MFWDLGPYFFIYIGFSYSYPWYDNPEVTMIIYPSTTPYDQGRVTISTACPQHYVMIQYIYLLRTSSYNRNIQDLLCFHILSLSIHFFFPKNTLTFNKACGGQKEVPDPLSGKWFWVIMPVLWIQLLNSQSYQPLSSLSVPHWRTFFFYFFGFAGFRF